MANDCSIVLEKIDRRRTRYCKTQSKIRCLQKRIHRGNSRRSGGRRRRGRGCRLPRIPENSRAGPNSDPDPNPDSDGRQSVLAPSEVGSDRRHRHRWVWRSRSRRWHHRIRPRSKRHSVGEDTHCPDFALSQWVEVPDQRQRWEHQDGLRGELDDSGELRLGRRRPLVRGQLGFNSQASDSSLPGSGSRHRRVGNQDGRQAHSLRGPHQWNPRFIGGPRVRPVAVGEHVDHR